MFGLEIVLTLIFVRVILPVGLLLCLGDYLRQQEMKQRMG